MKSRFHEFARARSLLSGKYTGIPYDLRKHANGIGKPVVQNHCEIYRAGTPMEDEEVGAHVKNKINDTRVYAATIIGRKRKGTRERIKTFLQFELPWPESAALRVIRKSAREPLFYRENKHVHNSRLIVVRM